MSDPKIIKLAITNIFDDIRLNADICVYYDLYWYICISSDPINIPVGRRSFLHHIASLSVLELRTLLGNNYDGPLDHASMLFAAFSGQKVPFSDETEERYQQVVSYNPSIVYNLAFKTYSMIDDTIGTYSLIGPYRYLSQQRPAPIENLIFDIRIDEVERLIEKYDIGPILRRCETDTQHGVVEITDPEERLNYLKNDLSGYNRVFTREVGTQLPPNLIDRNREEILDILSIYTNMELINNYEPRTQWFSRSQLLNIIADDILGIRTWSILAHGYCTNDDSMNIMTGESHSEVDKDNLNDPTLSYGVHKNYRCYQCEELAASFREYNGVFMFMVPDWLEGVRDPVTNQQLDKEFSIESMKQLKRLLELYPINDNGLLDKISEGLQLISSAKMRTAKLRNEYLTFSDDRKRIVNLYISWMFMYGMWMRFWKGPGYQWPLKKVNVRAVSNRDIRASPEERDEHVFIQDGIRADIIEMYENDVGLKEWIDNLPAIYYDFSTNESSVASYTVKSTLDKIALGNMCMGFGSDTIMKTAYVYISEILQHPVGNEFDTFILQSLPQLQDLEYEKITNLLETSDKRSVRYTILNNRLRRLQNPIRTLDKFDPANYQNNVHV